MIAFKSPAQESLFDAVTSHLEGIGYRGDLLSRNYPFTDWFELEDVDRVAPVVTFGRVPTTYETTCHVVAPSNGRTGPALAAEFRALGAARLFEVHEDRVSVWRIGQSVTPSDELLVIPAGQLTQRFQENAEAWRPESVLRAKEIGVGTGEKQLDFFDAGLLVALEGHIRVKLGDLLKEALAKASHAYHRSLAGLDPTETQQLFRLVFRFLAAKVLHDRGVGEFASLSASDDAGNILEKVSQYYGRSDAVLADQAVRDAIKSTIWGRLNLQNLSVEVLAYIYEFTLVSHSLRKRLGIHGTPPSIARYIVRNLPIDRIPRDERLTVEPCSGHAVFLVAALQRLRELMPPDMAAAERHKYFVRMLRGFELDAFALEVSLLCLMLVDFPNPNGWEMVNTDVFDSPAFDAALKEARIVLCNPPYEDIPIEKRADYGNLRSVHKPDEIIHRVLDHLHPNGMLGFVLPRRILDDRGSRAIRRKLAERFDEIEIVELPESRVFYVSEHRSVLVLAKRRSRGGGLDVRFVNP
jgi:type I restriction-modification system DNA methylase subunit